MLTLFLLNSKLAALTPFLLFFFNFLLIFRFLKILKKFLTIEYIFKIIIIKFREWE